LAKGKLIQFAFLILCFVFLFRVVLDPDLGWHLGVGKYIWENKTVPQKDLFSFSLPDYPYIYHSWLAEVFLYAAYRNFGLWGVTFFYCFFATFSIWLIVKTCRLRVDMHGIYLFFLLLIPLIQSVVFLRLQVFSFLGLSFIYYIFRRYLQSETKLVWLLPIIFLLWANLHGGFFLGLLFFLSLLLIEALVFLFKEVVPFKVFGNLGSALPLKKGLMLLLSFLASIIAVLLNPYRAKIYEQAFLMGTNQFATKFNLDWSPLVRSGDLSWLSAIILFALIVGLLIFKSKVELREKLLVLLFFSLALKLNRFSLALLPPLLVASVVLGNELAQKFKPPWQELRLFLQLMICIVFLVYVGTACDFFLRMKRAYADESIFAQEIVPPYTYPWKAVEYIRQNPVPERLLNDYNWGGYLIWKLPERKFFIDGRMDNFFVDGEPFASYQQEIVSLGPKWEEYLNRYQIEAVLISSQWPLAQALRLLPQWKLLYEDETSVLFTRVQI